MINLKLIVGGMICVSCLLTSVSSMASDKINSNAVHFDKGSSGTIIKSTVIGGDVNDYTLVAKAGQTMHVSMTSQWPHPYFNVIAPGNNAIYNGSLSGDTFEQRLTAGGKYTVRVYQMGGARDEGKTSAYALTFKITD
ncbi:DNA breaking-rejoining protein [Klebsiella spallanzanii]|uniref:Inhibitor of g-type lysozyme n=1 Tax=Klebsiella spallanzanii TaxID=2587528 RepID=A0A564NJV6_9ENTR|nr:DNA breaking-rejoining protein [Klebsiella spallanzanii]VUT06398.1 Inhibitor of g-type lysozyme [Klebsiella spallanzanii]